MTGNTNRVVRGAPPGAGGKKRPGGVVAKPRPRRPRFGIPEVNGNGRDAGRGRRMTEGELEELKEALDEYERTKGDWSKAR
jgi:hypothetical protein